jgi:hypothetical protein
MPETKLQADRFEKAAPNDCVDAWIYSAFRKDHWVARIPGDQFRADHPGAALQVGQDVYEILKIEETGVGGYVLRYGLKKWDTQFAIRKVIPYTDETRARAVAEHLEQADIKGLRQRLLWAFIFAGLAPDPLQRRWETKSGVNMTVVSFASSFAVLGAYMLLMQLYSGSFGIVSVADGAMTFLALESAFRMIWILTSGKPHGTLLLAFPYMLYEAVFHPERKAKKQEWIRFSLEGDKVIWRGQEHLVVRSMLFDEMLAGPNPVRIEGAVYKPLNWHEEGKGLQRWFVYEFGRIESEEGKRYCEYTRPRSPERQKAVEEYSRRRDRAHTFALVWGMYPAAEQLRLENAFHFPGAYWTAVTAGFIIVGGVFQAWILLMAAFPRPALLIPLYWVLESLYRLHRSKSAGQPAGSLIGYVLALAVHAPR